MLAGAHFFACHVLFIIPINLHWSSRIEKYRIAAFDCSESSDLGTSLCSVLAGTSEWANLYVRHCFRLYKRNMKDECWKHLETFFFGLRACCTEVDAIGGRGWPDMTTEERRERVVLVQRCRTMLQLAGRLWTAARNGPFQQFLFVARTAGLGRSDSAVELFELEAKAHHGSGSGVISGVVIPALVKVFSTAKQRDHGDPVDPHRWAAWLDTGPSPSLSGDPCTGPSSPPPLLEDLGLTEAETMAAAIVDLHLLLIGQSPLTGCPLVSSNGEPHASTSKQKASALGVAGTIGVSDDVLVKDGSFRMHILFNLYPRLRPTTVLRAKCAYALGCHELQKSAMNSSSGRAVAEKLLFEALFLLDHGVPPVPGVSAVLSGLGEACLIRYAESLLANNKYRYAVLALEAAAECNRLRLRSEPQALHRRLAVVCADHGDYERSFRYYNMVLNKARQVSVTS